MPIKRYPHSIRFSQEEWDNITHAAEVTKMAPGEYAREAAVLAAAEESGLAQHSLTP